MKSSEARTLHSRTRFTCPALRTAWWRVALLVAAMAAAPGCATVVASAGSGLAGNLTVAMMNQDDPAIVRDGAPAYLLMLDSIVEGSPNNEAVLAAAAELYAAYGVVFVDDPERARKLTSRAKSYGQRALCAANKDACAIWELRYEDYVNRLSVLREKDANALYTFCLSWIAHIRAHSDDYNALARLPQVEAGLMRLRELDPKYEEARVEHYLGVLNTIRPPALGGNFDAGKAYFDRAIELSGGRDLTIQVDYARYYARALYDRELHDSLLQKVLSTPAEQRGYTLFNTIAQEDAKELLSTADDYF